MHTSCILRCFLTLPYLLMLIPWISGGGLAPTCTNKPRADNFPWRLTTDRCGVANLDLSLSDADGDLLTVVIVSIDPVVYSGFFVDTWGVLSCSRAEIVAANHRAYTLNISATDGCPGNTIYFNHVVEFYDIVASTNLYDPVITPENVNVTGNLFFTAGGSSNVATLTVTDADTGADGVIDRVTITGNPDNAPFTLSSADPYILRLTGSLDTFSNQITLTIQAVDQGTPPRTGVITFTVYIEHTPYFNSVRNGDTLYFCEDFAEGDVIANLTHVNPSGLDTTYTITGSHQKRQKSSQEPASPLLFEASATSEELLVAAGVAEGSFDVDAAGVITQYNVTISVSDGLYGSSIKLTLVIDDVNDNTPEITGVSDIVIIESTLAGFPIFDVTTTDGDRDAPNNEVTLSLSGTNSDHFVLDGSTLKLADPSPLNYTLVSEYNLLLTATDGADPVDQLSSNVSFRIAVMTVAQCPPEVDIWNTTWEAGWPGRRTYLNGLCPEGFQGYASRLCDDNAAWHTPVYNCTSETLVKIQQEFYGPSANVTRALIQLANYTSGVNGTAKRLTVGDVQATTSLMTSITDVASRQNNLTIDQIKDYLEVADNLMEDSCKTSWKSIINETRTGVDTLLDNIDKFVEVMSRKEGSSGGGEEYAKTNFYLTVKSARNCKRDISFPNRSSETVPKWAKATVDSIFLPCSKGIDGAAYSSVMYRDLRDIIPQRAKENDTEKEVLNSRVMSLTLFQKKNVPLDNNLLITFQLFEKMHSFIPRCSYWKQGNTGGWWDTDRCTLDSYDEASGVVVCKCSHLTNFAILMSQVPASKDHTQALSIISLVGCIVSMLFLAITVCLYLGLWSFVRGERSILLLNLCITLFVAYLVFLAGVNAIENKDVCTFVAVFLHFVYLVVFFIMLTKGLFLGKTVLKPFNKTPIAKWCLLGTYGGAAVIVGISMAVTQLEGYGTSTSCWLSIDSGLIWAFLGPVLLVIVINSIIIVLVLRSMYGTAAMSKKTNKEKTMTGLRSVGVLLPVMGVAWVFGVFSVSEDTVVFQYLFAIFNSLQGILIFIFHCIMNQKIREGLSKKLKKDRSFTSSTNKKSQNTKNTNM